MDIDFRCAECGDCCRGFRLPLSIEEALSWLHDGNPVEVLCEAIPWVDEPPLTNFVATFKRERSFSGMSGALPIRVIVTLAAPLGSGCPNLSTDNQCKIYERRPRTCRTYPAEASRLIELVPQSRRCPPEAWQPGGQPLMRQGTYVGSKLIALVQDKLTQSVNDAPLLSSLRQALGVHRTALSNEVALGQYGAKCARRLESGLTHCPIWPFARLSGCTKGLTADTF